MIATSFFMHHFISGLLRLQYSTPMNLCSSSSMSYSRGLTVSDTYVGFYLVLTCPGVGILTSMLSYFLYNKSWFALGPCLSVSTAASLFSAMTLLGLAWASSFHFYYLKNNFILLLPWMSFLFLFFYRKNYFILLLTRIILPPFCGSSTVTSYQIKVQSMSDVFCHRSDELVNYGLHWVHNLVSVLRHHYSVPWHSLGWPELPLFIFITWKTILFCF